MADGFESEIATLRAENGSLSEELAQVRADKEFVWSLWKRLQVASPDLTQAVSLVVKREKEKSEVKDRKVLQILQVKDQRIEELQKTATNHAADLKAVSKRKADLEVKVSHLNEEVHDLNEKNNYLDQQLRSRSNKERTLDGLHRHVIEGFEKDKFDLSQQLSELKAELSVLKAENADLNAIKIVHENKIKHLQLDLKDSKTRCETLFDEAEELKRQVNKHGLDFRKHGAQIESKDEELSMVKKELSEIWCAHKKCKSHAVEQATLIHQLQNLQQETQKMMKSQDETHSLEIKSLQTMHDELEMRYNDLKNVESQLRQDHLILKEQLMSKDDQIRDLHQNLKDAIEDTTKCVLLQTNIEPSNVSVQATEPIIDYEFKLESMKAELELLRDRIKEKNRIIKGLQKGNPTEMEDDLDTTPVQLKSSPNRTSTPDKPRSQSASPMKEREVHARYQALQKRHKNTQELLKLKTQELEEMRASHGKRLERLKTVQNNYKLVKDQLKTLEDEFHGPKKKKKMTRAEPKSLQKEDNDSVWNELTYFKQENKNLVVERLDLQEQLDSLKVQASQDAATIHELQVSLEQEREEVNFLKKQREQILTPKQNFKDELRSIRIQLQNKEAAVARLSSERDELEQLREKYEGERRCLQAELNSCKHEVSDKRMEIADLKKDITRLHKEIHRRGVAKKDRRRKRKTATKKYQRSLNQSIEEMNKLIDNFGDDGWEEVSSDSEEDEEFSSWTATDTDDQHATARTTESLGGAIVRAAQAGEELIPVGTSPVKVSGRQVESVEDHIRRMGNKHEPPTRDEDIMKKRKRPRIVPKIQLRPVSTQTVSFGGHSVPSFGYWKKRASGYGVHQVSTLKQRLGSLQQQVQALRATKLSLTKSLREYKENHEQLQSDLSLANQRLRMIRQNNQKLVLDMDKVQHEKLTLTQRLSLNDNSDSSAPNTPRTDRSDQDWKNMEKRLKASSSEVSRQSALIKSLKTELDDKDQQLKTLQEKVNRLERDNSQKRILLEDNRLRLKIAQEHEKTDMAAFDELEAKVKSLSETCDKQKTSLESFRKRLAVVSKERREFEDNYIRTKSELERKTRIAAELNAKNIDLESMATELEAAAQQQLRQLAKKSEMAIDTAHNKLQQTHNKVQCFQIFVQSLAENLLSSTQHARALVRKRARLQAAAEAAELNSSQEKNVKGKALHKAQELAKNILNISDTDLNDMMNPQEHSREEEDGDSEAEKKVDRRWVKRCQKILSTEDDFAQPLVETFMEKVEETVMILTPV